MDDDMYVLALRGSDVTHANSLRRIMLSELPTLAIDQVYFQANTTNLTDETIAHRLSLVALNSNLIYNNGVGEFSFSLDITCEEEEMWVTAGMLTASDQKVTPVHPETVIVILHKGQKIKFNATAAEGCGKDHAKWMPVAGIGQYQEKDAVFLTVELVGNVNYENLIEKAIEILPSYKAKHYQYANFSC